MRSDAIRVHFPTGIGYPVAFRPLLDLAVAMRDVGLRPGRVLVVSDKNVADLYGVPVDTTLKQDGWEPRLLALPPGESTKSPEHLQAIYDAALGWGIDRKTPIVALGGGVIGDLAGFAAATLLRGVPLVHVPTSLLAQVDSSIGGKTGINHDAGKNLVGAFHQPALVLTDTNTLATLPPREWMSGAAEVIKHALIGDPRLFEILSDAWPRFAARDQAVVGEVLRRACQVKVDIVSRDERERGPRMYLNFGHTFGHALEQATEYQILTHGEAVAIGMRAALYLSRRYHPKLDYMRTDLLVRQIPVPPIPADVALGEVMQAMRADKKVDAGRLRFVLLKRLGQPYLEENIAPADLEAAWRHVLVT
ncbi:MAG: 3-dehydroquinate synthase [Rhodothermales bacterium]|nr:3-dehydroquinate synthase [Rhodothermales bacterium]MBO6781360.1 3-dehydroquinate synthase [Rhodothermales bacterium]